MKVAELQNVALPNSSQEELRELGVSDKNIAAVQTILHRVALPSCIEEAVNKLGTDGRFLILSAVSELRNLMEAHPDKIRSKNQNRILHLTTHRMKTTNKM